MRRWLLKLALFLVLGAICNVAVAWGFAIASRFGDMGEFSQIGNAADGDTVVIVWRKVGGAIAAFEHGGWATHREYGELWAEPADLPTWPSVERYSDDITCEAAFGMPLLAVEYWCDPGLRVYGGMNVGVRTSAPRLHDGNVLPLRPLWPGFAINTVFYALVLWLLFAAPFALRRRRRIKRGLCPKCAYDLRGSRRGPHPNPLPEGEGETVCPECGAAEGR